MTQERRENHPNRQVSRLRATLGHTYSGAELREAAARGRINAPLQQGSSIPRSQMTLAERLRDPDD